MSIREPLHLLLVCLVFWGCPTYAQHEGAHPPRLAVLYDSADDFSAAQFDQIVAGIEGGSALEVVRISLDPASINSIAALLAAGVKLAFNDSGPIAVVYPDIGEPYRSVFNQILAGIETSSPGRIVSIPVANGRSSADLANELRRHEVRAVIALGRHGLQVASNLEGVPVVAGAILSPPEGEAKSVSVFSLAPDPGLLFARLREIAPTIRRVHVVFDPRQNAWLLRLARDAAQTSGLEIVGYEAQDLRAALRFYQDIVANADSRRDAVWLPQDSAVVDDSTVLPFLLQESWNRSLVVFSSNLAHVRRGALFALYPNNQELGRNLASYALGAASAMHTARSVLPLRSVYAAVNLRTANHLGLAIDAKTQDFQLVFPAP